MLKFITVLDRRIAFVLVLSIGLGACQPQPAPLERPHILILHADQWRAQSLGYAGDPQVITPHIDQLAAESANFTQAVSGMPVCCPHRASLMTGQRPLTHGVFMNDVPLDSNAYCLAEALADAGYQTGYIGKWHLDGRGRSNFTPPGGRRQGFQYWKALECSHDYNRSAFYFGNSALKRFWEGYDAIAQTDDAIQYIQDHAGDKQPFFLMLSWGTPHAPYHTAPERYRALYEPDTLLLAPNVPDSLQDQVRRDLAGYYAHATALDDQVGKIRAALAEAGIQDQTLILFTSDHGDLLGAHGAYKKQQPYEESIRVPFLVHHARISPAQYPDLINTEDIMPTLLGLAGVPVPRSVEGMDFSSALLSGASAEDSVALISCVQPFGQWNRVRHQGREYRGIRTYRYTYARSLEGPWLLFDNQADPYQLNNLSGQAAWRSVRDHLDQLLQQHLDQQEDAFLPGPTYVAQWGYELDATGTVPYTR